MLVNKLGYVVLINEVNEMNDQRERMLTVMLGDAGAGKSVLITRLRDGMFYRNSPNNGHYKWSNGNVKLSIWVPTDKPDYVGASPSNQDIAFIVYDANDLKNGLINISSLLRSAKNKVQTNDMKRVIIVGSKADLTTQEERTTTRNIIGEYLKSYGMDAGQHVFVSAKTGEGIETLSGIIKSFVTPTQQTSAVQLANSLSNSGVIGVNGPTSNGSSDVPPQSKKCFIL